MKETGDEGMFIHKNTLFAEFIHRPNRFTAYVKLNDEDIIVHVPNTGRCREILTPGTMVILRQEDNPERKTKYDLIAGFKGNKLINIDSQIPNSVVEEALKNKKIAALSKYSTIEREKTFGSSRFDFKLTGDKGEEYYLEIKGVTYEDNGKCMFPDAPTERGRKHLMELVDVKKSGKGAGVLFLIQMKDVKYFTPYDIMDKAFGEALRLAYVNGVNIFSYDCNVGINYITLDSKVKVKL